MKTIAAVAGSVNASLTFQHCDLSELEPDEILVQVKACGICHTDVAVMQQHIPLPFPRVLGHEGAGIVEMVGNNVRNVGVGDHVLLSFGSCGTCENCQSDHPAYCDHFIDINMNGSRRSGPAIRCEGLPVNGSFFAQSSFATRAIANIRNAVKVDKELPLEILAPLGCGIQTGLGTVLNVLRPTFGNSIAIFGAGSVGLAAVMGAKIAGCSTIVAVDLHESRLQLALEVGATHVFSGSTPDLVEKLAVLAGPGMHCSIDTTGNPEVVAKSIACLRKRGRSAQLAAAPRSTRLSIDPSVLISRGIQICGVIEGDAVPSVEIPNMIELYRKGLLPLEKIVKTYPFRDINDAIQAMENGSVVKPVLLMT